MPARDILKLIYKVVMIAITAALIGGAILAYYYATTANQLLLISGILGLLALIAGLSISKLDDQDAQAATYRSILDDVRRHTKVSVNFAEPGSRGVPSAQPAAARKMADISIGFAEPEVHRVDAATLDDARRMAAEGASIDDICRAIDPDHDRHDRVHQEAFRRIVKAMLEQS